MLAGEFHERAGVDAAGRLLGGAVLPTAVIAANDLVAVGLIDRLEQDGVRIPEDVSVIGYDNTFIAGLAHVQLTTINQPRREMGVEAFTLVLERTAGRSERVTRVHEPTLVVRSTTGPPPSMRLLLGALAIVALVPGWRGSPAPPEPLRVTVSAHGVATAIPLRDGRVLTVAHVLDGARFVLVDGRPARVVRVDRRLDLAELAVPGLVAPTVRTVDSGTEAVVRVLRDGEPVTLSAPVRRRVTASIAGHSRPALELAATVEAGDSGAPVLDARGRVLGIVFARGSRGAWAVALTPG